MVFKCQEDSVLKEFVSKVVSIEQAETKINNGKDVITGFNIVFEDTILFPEGGGQNCDHGKLNDEIKVVSVIRKGPLALHFAQTDNNLPFAVGDEVKMTVDWIRRKDHMQQHSGQHLISAIFDKMGYSTKAWWLGDYSSTSYIELDKDLDAKVLQEVEEFCNHHIRESLPMTVQNFDKLEDMSEEVLRASRGLPKDQVGAIRVVTIQGIDSNPCCGTHVKNLSELQVIKLMNIEKGKNKILVHFLVGQRVLNKLGVAFERELEFNNLLKGGPASHSDLIKKTQANLKAANKTVQKLSKELAIFEAEKLNEGSGERFKLIFRSDGVDPDFIQTFLRTLKRTDLFLTIAVSDSIDSKSGQLILQGEPDDITELSPKICVILGGNGKQNKNRFNAKITNLHQTKVKDCEKLLQSYFEAKP